MKPFYVSFLLGGVGLATVAALMTMSLLGTPDTVRIAAGIPFTALALWTLTLYRAQSQEEERKRATQEYAAWSALNDTKLGLALFDVQGHVVRANVTCARLLGQDPQELQHLGLEQMIGLETHEEKELLH
ncbi:MAG TPA: hypothetical protein VF898_13050, partial [Chloroflexota bacterium]